MARHTQITRKVSHLPASSGERRIKISRTTMAGTKPWAKWLSHS